METVRFVGKPTATVKAKNFFKTFSCIKSGIYRSYSVGDFFLVKNDVTGEGPCIAELVLQWEDLSTRQKFAQFLLYFLPDVAPKGRQVYHGEHEVLRDINTTTTSLEVLSEAIVEDREWNYGLLIEGDPKPDKKVEEEVITGDIVYTDSRLNSQKIAILTYANYCRYRAMLSRLDKNVADYLNNRIALALGIPLKMSQNMGRKILVFFCRDTITDHGPCDKHRAVIPNGARAKKTQRGQRGRPRRKNLLQEQRLAARNLAAIYVNSSAVSTLCSRPSVYSGGRSCPVNCCSMNASAAKKPAPASCMRLSVAAAANSKTSEISDWCNTIDEILPQCSSNAGEVVTLGNNGSVLSAVAGGGDSPLLMTPSPEFNLKISAALAEICAKITPADLSSKAEDDRNILKYNILLDEKLFFAELNKFMKARNTPLQDMLHTAGAINQINLFLLYRKVQEYGGYDEISRKRQWKRLYNALATENATKFAFNSRRHSERLVLLFERHTSGEASITPSEETDNSIVAEGVQMLFEIANKNFVIKQEPMDADDEEPQQNIGIPNEFYPTLPKEPDPPPKPEYMSTCASFKEPDTEPEPDPEPQPIPEVPVITVEQKVEVTKPPKRSRVKSGRRKSAKPRKVHTEKCVPVKPSLKKMPPKKRYELTENDIGLGLITQQNGPKTNEAAVANSVTSAQAMSGPASTVTSETDANIPPQPDQNTCYVKPQVNQNYAPHPELFKSLTAPSTATSPFADFKPSLDPIPYAVSSASCTITKPVSDYMYMNSFPISSTATSPEQDISYYRHRSLSPSSALGAPMSGMSYPATYQPNNCEKEPKYRDRKMKTVKHGKFGYIKIGQFENPNYPETSSPYDDPKNDPDMSEGLDLRPRPSVIIHTEQIRSTPPPPSEMQSLENEVRQKLSSLWPSSSVQTVSLDSPFFTTPSWSNYEKPQTKQFYDPATKTLHEVQVGKPSSMSMIPTSTQPPKKRIATRRAAELSARKELYEKVCESSAEVTSTKPEKKSSASKGQSSKYKQPRPIKQTQLHQPPQLSQLPPLPPLAQLPPPTLPTLPSLSSLSSLSGLSTQPMNATASHSRAYPRICVPPPTFTEMPPPSEQEATEVKVPYTERVKTDHRMPLVLSSPYLPSLTRAVSQTEAEDVPAKKKKFPYGYSVLDLSLKSGRVDDIALQSIYHDNQAQGLDLSVKKYAPSTETMNMQHSYDYGIPPPIIPVRKPSLADPINVAPSTSSAKPSPPVFLAHNLLNTYPHYTLPPGTAPPMGLELPSPSMSLLPQAHMAYGMPGPSCSSSAHPSTSAINHPNASAAAAGTIQQRPSIPKPPVTTEHVTRSVPEIPPALWNSILSPPDRVMRPQFLSADQQKMMRAQMFPLYHPPQIRFPRC